MKENLNSLIIRPEDYNDRKAVERLTFEAFETMDIEQRTHTNEHFLTSLLRDDTAFIKELDLVAELNGEIVGSIIYSKCFITRPRGDKTQAIVFGPLSVSPKHHNKGIGTRLINESLKKAKSMGFGAVLITGHPNYYNRFGFVPASEFNIVMPDGSSIDAFMALELKEGYLGELGGTWELCKAFDLCEEKAAFEKYHEQFLRDNKIIDYKKP